MKIAVVTGASTGIGFDACHRLSLLGFQVLACVRTITEELHIQLPRGVWIAKLDVTSTSDIQKVIQEYDLRLNSADEVHLINNAGLALPGPLEALPVFEVRKIFDVNVFGLLEVSQAFLPFIRKTRGRIVNIGSISGIHSSPFLGAYCASKYAVEAISDAQRRELQIFGVKVICIEPGSIATPIWDKGLKQQEDLFRKLLHDRLPVYKKHLQRFAGFVEKIAQGALPASFVSDAIEKAVLQANPPTRIMVVNRLTWLQMMMFRYLPDRFMDRIVAKALFR
jgi:NAD(P)-dependent dehydrogenase (short-subunit alcohol dehydrogenase family)